MDPCPHCLRHCPLDSLVDSLCTSWTPCPHCLPHWPLDSQVDSLGTSWTPCPHCLSHWPPGPQVERSVFIKSWRLLGLIGEPRTGSLQVGFRVLGCRVLGCRVLGFRVLGFPRAGLYDLRCPGPYTLDPLSRVKERHPNPRLRVGLKL